LEILEQKTQRELEWRASGCWIAAVYILHYTCPVRGYPRGCMLMTSRDTVRTARGCGPDRSTDKMHEIRYYSTTRQDKKLDRYTTPPLGAGFQTAKGGFTDGKILGDPSKQRVKVRSQHSKLARSRGILFIKTLDYQRRILQI